MTPPAEKLGEKASTAAKLSNRLNDLLANTVALVSGGTGGIGSHLVTELQQHTSRTVTLKSRLGDSSAIQDELTQLGALERVKHVCLFLLASMASVSDCEENPRLAHEVNVQGNAALTGHVVHWAKKHNITLSVFFASTSHVYQNTSEERRLNESDPLGARSVYAATKIKAEETLERLSSEMDFSLVTGRIFGVLGPGQRSYLVLPGLMNRVRKRLLQNIPGLSNTRDYMDIRDAARTVRELMALDLKGATTVNICTGEGITIRHLLDEVINCAERNSHLPIDKTVVSQAAPSSHDVRWIVGDPTRMQNLLGHSAKTIPLKQSVSDAWLNSEPSHNYL